jgi:small GTP-binding protein
MESQDTSQYDLTFKMIVIGDPGVGKSCLTGRAIKDKFDGEYAPTIGFEFLTYTVKIEDKIIKLQVWDTCGQEMYRSLITNFYRNASLAMMVYSIDSRESFIHINTWLKEIRLQSHPDVKIILIGNKNDLEDKRQVTFEEAKKYKEENQLLCFEETSAKTGINAKKVFTEAAKILFDEHLKYKKRANNINFNDTVKVNANTVPAKPTNTNQKRNNGCC